MNRRGFTLLEVAISLLILVAGLAGILVLFPVGFDASRVTEDTTVVSLLAQGKMEELKRDGYASLPASASGTFTGTTYAWTVTSSDVIAGELKQVALVISWTRGGRNFSQTLVTYVGRLRR